MRARPGPVPPVAGKGLECLDHVAVCLREPIGLRERARPRDLVQHLALARAGHLDCVEVLRDFVVAPGEQLQPLDRIVDLLAEILLLVHRPGGRDGLGGHCIPTSVRRRFRFRVRTAGDPCRRPFVVGESHVAVTVSAFRADPYAPVAAVFAASADGSTPSGVMWSTTFGSALLSCSAASSTLTPASSAMRCRFSGSAACLT